MMNTVKLDSAITDELENQKIGTAVVKNGKKDKKDILKVKLLSDLSKVPSRKTKGSAGLDIYSVESMQIMPKNMTYVSTGIAIECPAGTYAKVSSKSKLAGIYRVTTFGGVIDPDYRGEIIVLLYNFSDEIYFIEAGDPVAQIILEKYNHCNVKVTKHLSETKRNKSAGLLESLKSDEAIRYLRKDHPMNDEDNIEANYANQISHYGELCVDPQPLTKLTTEEVDTFFKNEYGYTKETDI